MGRGRFYTKAELCRAEQLKAMGLTWAQVAERLGRGPRALMEACAKERRGLRASGRGEALRARRERLIAAAEAGEGIASIARREGMKKPLVCMILAGAGLDAEVRADIRRHLEWRQAA